MARWRLSAPHYIYTDNNTEWEYKETDRTSGKQARKVYQVPEYLDAETIVCLPGKGLDTDIPIKGGPGPDMVPLDEEAKKLSERLSSSWKHPIDSLPATGNFSESLLEGMQREVARLTSVPSPGPTADSVSPSDFAALQNQVADLIKQNQELMQKLGGRRV
jgi:hypothetical protein